MADIKRGFISSLCITASFSALSIYSMELKRSQCTWDIPSLCDKAAQSLDLYGKVKVKLERSASKEDIECIVGETEILGSMSRKIERMPRSQASVDFNTLQKKFSSEEILFKAVKDGRCRLVAKALKTQLNLEYKDEVGDTCLHVAIKYQKSFTVQQLVNCGARWDSLNCFKLSPLMIAISKEYQNVVHTCLEGCQGDINHQGLKGWTPLHMAVIEQNEEFVSMILKKCPNHTIKDNTERTALDYAQNRNNKAIIALLKSYTNQKTFAGKKNKVPVLRKRKRQKRR